MQETPIDPKARRRNRKIFLILVLAFAVPYIAAVVVYNLRDTAHLGQQTNIGKLVQPVRPIGEFPIEQLDAAPLTSRDLQGKWLLITVSGSRCDARCKRHLYELRQIRRALAQDRRRVERLLVLLDTQHLDELRLALRDYRGTRVMTGPEDAVSRLIALLDTGFETGADSGHNRDANHNEKVENRVFIVDPLGNLMMEYPADADPVGILKDLQRLLKLSKIG